MVSILSSCKSSIRKVKAGQVVVGLTVLCVVMYLSVMQRSSIKKHEMLKHTQSCKCIDDKQDINLLHAIPLLLFPALETSDTQQLSVTNRQHCALPVKKQTKTDESSSSAGFLSFQYFSSNCI